MNKEGSDKSTSELPDQVPDSVICPQRKGGVLPLPNVLSN